LDGNWRVLERASRGADDTGGRFSVGYIVEEAGGRRAFLKALDYAPALRGGELATLMRSLTEGYLFERARPWPTQDCPTDSSTDHAADQQSDARPVPPERVAWLGS
jgi:hypothetical protein